MDPNNSFKIGKFLDKYVKEIVWDELSDTKGNKGISYNEYVNDWEIKWSKKSYIKKFYDKIPKKNNKIYVTYTMYCGAPMVFPSKYVKLILDELPKFDKIKVLDPTMGWGTRLLSFLKQENLGYYIGIDCNFNLKQYYPLENEKFKLYFTDCLTFDYSMVDYNLVFTSLPYYNTETYNNQIFKNRFKRNWDENFYKPLFNKLWDNLKPNGFLVLNITEDIYNRCFDHKKEFLYKRIDMIGRRRVSGKNLDYFYIWHK